MEKQSLIEVFGQRPTRMKLLKDSLNRIDIGENSRVLEAGCSFGDGIAFVCEETGARGHGVDMVEEYVDIARDKHGHIEFLCGSVYDLDYEDNSFDLVFSQAAFSLLKEKDKAISEFDRILGPGGHMIINDFVIKEEVKTMVGEEMNFIPCFNSISTIEEYVKLFESKGFSTVHAEDRYSEIISTTIHLSKIYKCTPMEMASLFARILGTGDDAEEKSQCFFRDAKISYGQLIFKKNQERSNE